MSYELWDSESGNLMASYATELDAARDIAMTQGQIGIEGVLNLALAFEDRHGKTRPIASGAMLAKWAEATLGQLPTRRRNGAKRTA